MSSSQITAVLPTYNRPAYLERLLRYLSTTRFPGRLLVADDSTGAEFEENLRILERFNQQIRLSHLRMQRVSLFEKIRIALESVATPYTVIAADDDFFLFNGVLRGIEFLESHLDYSVAHGQAAVFTLQTGGVRGEIASVLEYPQMSLEQASASERLVMHLSSYTTTWYSVENTENMRKSWGHAATFGHDWRFAELTASCLSVVRGKTKQLDGLYMVREANPDSLSGAETATEFDWLIRESWHSDYERFKELMSCEVAQRDSIELESARRVVKKAFWAYVATLLRRNWEHHFGQLLPKSNPPLRWHEAVMELAHRGSVFARRRLVNNGQEISLRNFLRPKFKWHAEFQPIYDAIQMK